MYLDDNLILWAIGVLIICVLVAIGVSASNQQKEWEVFKVEHKCNVVAHIDGDVFNTIGLSGSGNMVVGVGSTSSKTGWLCDDGVTYYK